MEARYRFRVEFRLVLMPGVVAEPAAFETQARYSAVPPGDEGWLFFRDHLWRGQVSSPAQMRSVMGDALDVAVTAVEFRAFETDPAYLDALQSAIEAELAEFRADDVDEVISKYFGSRLEVQPEGI